MYHTIVARVAKTNFESVNNKDYQSLLKGCTPTVHHEFGGEHALGGKRHTREGFENWLHRLGRLAPELRLAVQDIWVKGWPWSTIIIVRWTATDRSFTFPDGRPYINHGVHIIKMKWFKVYDIDANENSQIVAEMLAVKAGQGNQEACLPPITS